MKPFRVLPTGLSARLLALTVAFVMLGEVLIYVPSVSRFRLAYLEDCIGDATIASLALAVPPDNRLPDALGRELLESARSYGLSLRGPESRALVLSRDMPHESVALIDLREMGFLAQIGDALATLAGDGRRMLRVVAPSPRDERVLVETVIDEAPLREAMFAFSQRILVLSVALSLLAAVLLYVSLQWLFVRPMRRLIDGIVAFRADPEKPGAAISPSGRSDEIGRAERELAHMQEGLLAALRQRARLAQLGAAMAKINHDLRNILSSAQLVSDALAASDDPKMKRVAPTLMGALDRAIALCSETLDFAAGGAAPPVRRTFALKGVADEVFEVLAANPALAARKVACDNRIAPELHVEADRTQMFRVLANLVRNAIESGAGAVAVEASVSDGDAAIGVVDDGPGLSPRALERLFQPFAGSTRPGGTGLGLAIARELMRGHGGDIALAETGAKGTRFRLLLPGAVRDIAPPPEGAVRRLRGRGDRAINRP